MRIRPPRWLSSRSVFTLVLTLLLAVMTALASLSAPRAQAASPALGQTMWGTVHADTFGVNDAYDWAGSAGFDGNAAIQAAVKGAHVPLVRAWFPEYPNFGASGTAFSDAHQLAIAQTVVATGARCMANLTQPNTIAYDLHLVQILAPYCPYFELMNEPDYSGMNPVSAPNYIAFWNSFVPQARAIDPTAEFGGPALATEYGSSSSTYMQDVLNGMKASGVWPDFVSFHWYICAGQAQSACVADTAWWTPTHGKTVYGWLQQDFPGKSVALGITEWNMDPGNPSYAYDDTFMSQFMQTALSGLETNPYISFATFYDIGSYACWGACDLFRTFSSEPYTNTPSAIGSPRPEFGVLASEIARLSGGTVTPPSPPPPSPTATTPPPPPPPSPTATTPPPPPPTPVPTTTGCTGDGCSTPTPAPTTVPTTTRPCMELLGGVMTLGQCGGTFYPTGTTYPTGAVQCVEAVDLATNPHLSLGYCSGTFTH